MTDFHSGDVVMLDEFAAKTHPDLESQELVVITVNKHALTARKPDVTSITGTHGCFKLIRTGRKSCE